MDVEIWIYNFLYDCILSCMWYNFCCIWSCLVDIHIFRFWFPLFLTGRAATSTG